MQLLLHLKSDPRMRAEVASGVLNHFPLEGVISTQFGRLFAEYGRMLSFLSDDTYF